jgi:hypothetical protein
MVTIRDMTLTLRINLQPMVEAHSSNQMLLPSAQAYSPRGVHQGLLCLVHNPALLLEEALYPRYIRRIIQTENRIALQSFRTITRSLAPLHPLPSSISRRMTG